MTPTSVLSTQLPVTRKPFFQSKFVGTSGKTFGCLMGDMNSNFVNVDTSRFILSFSRMFLNAKHNDKTGVSKLRISSEGKKKPFLHTNNTNNSDVSNVVDGGVPIIDYSMLKSHDPAQLSEALEKLGKDCSDYGCFVVINHGIPKSLMKSVINGLTQFFDLEEEQKCEYGTKNCTDTIRYGKDSREYLKVVAHPQFHCPAKPPQLRNDLEEYNKKLRELGLVLLRGISMTLGLEEKYIEKTMKMETGYDFFSANNYPPVCWNLKDKPIAQLPHYDPGLINLIMQDVNGGLQIPNKGNWMDASFNPDCIFAAVADHLEILTNGKYKSLNHRVIVNHMERRITLPLFIGPSLDTVVSPSPHFVDENIPPAYRSLTYHDYLEANEYHIIDGKSCLKQIII